MSNDRIADLQERLRTLDAERAAIERELLAFESTKRKKRGPSEETDWAAAPDYLDADGRLITPRELVDGDDLPPIK